MQGCLEAVAVPERVAASANGDPAAFVVAPTRGSDELTGVWLGKLSGPPAKLSDTVPDTNLTSVPVSQAEELYAAMRRAGVPAPRESRQVGEPAHEAGQRGLATPLGELAASS